MDNNYTKENDMVNDEFFKKILSGNAILFVGAGFSRNAIGFDGKLPNAKELTKVLCGLAEQKYKEEYELGEVADYLIENIKDGKKILMNKLRDIFTVKEPLPEHISIVSLPWKRFYTTNYDDLIEESAKKNGDRINSYDLESEISMENSEEDRYCLHINGRIATLDEKTLNGSFKLTHSSYVSSNAFEKAHKWKKSFTNDITTSSIVVFIGYSLSDIEIERILQECQPIKAKVFFIAGSDKDAIKKSRYEKFGNLIDMNLSEFAKKVEKNRNTMIVDKRELKCLSAYKIELDSKSKITDNDRWEFLMYGKYKKSHLQNSFLSSLDKNYFVIKRAELQDIALENLQKSNALLVYGDMGNGKSIFLEQLATELANQEKVYFVNKGTFEKQKNDIETLAKSKNTSYIFIDSCLNYSELVKFVLEKNYGNIKTILASRKLDDSILSIKNRIEIDILDDDELEDIERIIEHAGLWGKKASFSYKRKLSYLRETCRAEFFEILIALIESEQMTKRVKNSLGTILANKELKHYLFAICFLHISDITISIALLEDILDNCNLKILSGNNFDVLISLNLISLDLEITPKSLIVSYAVLKKFFEPEEIIECAMNILARISFSKYDNETKMLYKQLLNFNRIERILDKDKRRSLVNYYEEIKNKIGIVKNDPHYWLQYAMCNIALNEYKTAQLLLDQAIGLANNNRLAKGKKPYETYKIDNQQARLYLKQAFTENSTETAWNYFIKADEILSKAKNDEYKYKVMLLYKDFFEKHLDSLKEDQKNNTKNKCKNHLIMLERNKNKYNEARIYKMCKEMLEKYAK